MLKPIRLILVSLVLMLSVIGIASADPISPYGVGTANANSSITANNATYSVLANVPLSTEDIAFPETIFYFLAFIGGVAAFFGIFLIALDSNPWVSIIMCGIISFGTFLSCALMAPYVATTSIVSQNLGGDIGNAIYITSVNNYVFSSWISYGFYGAAILGFVLIIAGFLLQMKEARRRANEAQAERNRNAEDYMRTEESISFRKRDRL